MSRQRPEFLAPTPDLAPSTYFTGIKMPKIKSTTPARELTAERARERLSYDPLTGEFRWKTPPNGRIAGQKAGTWHRSGYLAIQIDRRLHYAHRLAWLMVHGCWPTAQIDHLDGDRGNNALANLRDAAPKTNSENRRCAQPGNSTGLLGVCWVAQRGKYAAQIKTGGKHLNLGRYATAEEAHQVYLQAKRRLHAGNTL